MATTTRIAVNPDTYTQIADGSTYLQVYEFRVGHMRIVIQPHNDPAPLPEHVNYIEFDERMGFEDGSFDAYVMSPLGDAHVGVVTK